MGIRNLNSVLRDYNVNERVRVSDISGSIVGIDFSLFLYRFIYNNNNPIEGFMRQIMLFFRYNILPVYVLDGISPLEKSDILNKRAKKRMKIWEEIGRLEELKKIVLKMS